jgi:hypothetical protein
MGDPPTVSQDGVVNATEVTVPLVDGAELTHALPFDVRTFPLVPGDVRPVPPCPTKTVPLTFVAFPVKDPTNEGAVTTPVNVGLAKGAYVETMGGRFIRSQRVTLLVISTVAETNGRESLTPVADADSRGS